MYDYLYRIYTAIAENTSSELLLFFVILAVTVAPAYVFIFKDRKSNRKHDSDKQDKENEREKELFTLFKEMSESHNEVAREFSAVVAENTAVISTLKDILQSQGAESKLTTARIHEKIEQVANRLHERIDNVVCDSNVIKAEIAAIKADTAAIKELLKLVESWWRK